jgi:hypothetical protein
MPTIEPGRPENRRKSEISLRILQDGPTADLFLFSRLEAKRRRRRDFSQKGWSVILRYYGRPARNEV